MGKKLRTVEWGGVLVVMACAGILLGTGAVALAEESAPPLQFTGPAEVKLAGDRATAFQSGYIQPFPESAVGVLQRTREAKSLLGYGDIVRVRVTPTTDAKVGDRFTLFRPTKPVYHPITRDYMGRTVEVLGILAISQAPDGGIALAKIVQAFDSMATGDLLKPYEAPPAVPDQQVTSGPVTGTIVDFKDPRQLTAQGEIVYIDRGEKDGVALGDRFSIIRRGQRLSATEGNLDLNFAELKVIGLQARTATAHVLQSTDAIRRGDVINRLPPPPSKAEPAAAPPKEAAADTMAVAKTTPPPTPARRELAEMHFAFDKWQLSDEDKKTLAEHAAYLKENPTLAITIEGHADERGSAEYNRSLGEKRAEEVRRFLADAGVKNTLTVTSYGKDRPVCTEPNETCFARNRRGHLSVGN